MQKVVIPMGEPVEQIIPDSSSKAAKVVKNSVRDIEKDIEDLEELLDSLSGLKLSSNSQNQVLSPAAQTGGKSDTEKVLDLYREHFLPDDGHDEEVEEYEAKYNLSPAAADFMCEIERIKDLKKKEAVAKARYLDGSNSMNIGHVNEFANMISILKGGRDKVIDDLEVERTSLEKYSHEISALENEVLELNEKYPLPMDVDNANQVIDRLEEIGERVEQLEKRRRHELRRRPEIQSDYIGKNLKEFYSEEEFEQPVLYDLEQLGDAVEEAYENIVI